MYGVLSALVAIKHLISEFDISIPPGKQFQLYCDNRSVVDKISYRRQLRRTVNQHRHPDVDIELQLLHELQQLEHDKGCKVSLSFVKNHQDKHKTRNEMSFKE
jgi:hypothetical protein